MKDTSRKNRSTHHGRTALLVAMTLLLGPLLIFGGGAVQIQAGGTPTPEAGQGMLAPAGAGMYILNLSTGKTLSIGALGSFDSPAEAAWSPNGETVAVAGPVDPDTGLGGLKLANVSSGVATIIVPVEQGGVSRLTWSPDGSRLAWQLTPPIGAPGPSTRTLWVQQAGGTNRMLLASGAGPFAWTPDSNSITAVQILTDANGNDASQIITVDATTGAPVSTILASPIAACQIGVAWSADGAYLAYGGSGFHEGCLDSSALGLYTWEAATGMTRHLWTGPSLGPAWSADGKVLTEVRSLSGDSGISLASFRPDGSSQQMLATGLPNSFPYPDPAFQTAAGETMYAVADCTGAAAWVVDAGATQARNVTSPTFYAIGPRLSPDGRSVAFSGIGSKGAYLALAALDQPRVTTPLTGGSGIVAGDFSPDSGSIIVAVTKKQEFGCLNQ